MFRFRNNIDAEVLPTLIELREAGEPWKVVLKETGLSHSKAELAMMEHELFGDGSEDVEVAELTGELVKHLRDEGCGWGQIMVATQSSEGKVRDAWKLATGTHSDGQRVNHGGRFKFDDAELYVGELKPTGTSIPADQPVIREVARKEALHTRLLKAEPAVLRRVYERYVGTPPQKGWTPAKLVLEIGKAAQAKGLIVQVEEPANA